MLNDESLSVLFYVIISKKKFKWKINWFYERWNENITIYLLL